MKKRLKVLIIWTMSLLIILSGCASNNASNQSGSNQNTQTNSEGNSNDSLVFRLKTEPDTMDPHKTSGTGDPQVVQYQVYESLFREEADGTIVPALAESYELNEEKTAITLHLRDDVYFHNGEKMTADDVVFSLNRSIETGFNGTYVDAIENIEKLDETTVEITLKYSYTPIVTCLSTLSTAIVPKAYVEENGDDILARSPIGTGPYKLVNWTSGERLDFEAFPEYWRGEAAIKEASIVVIADNSTALISMETGDVDIMTNLSTSDIPLVESNPDLQFVTGPAASMVLFTFNNQKSVFSDIRMREAVYLCVDRQAIVDSCADGYGEVENSVMLAVLPEHPDNFTVPAQNIERAKELVAEAGYPDGVTIHVPTIDNGTYSKPTVMLQEQLALAGINLEVELMDRAAWNEKVISNTDYEFCCWALPITALDADFAASKFYGPNCSGGGNFSNCNIPEIDELILEGRMLEPGEERNEVYRQYCELIRDNYVVLPIYTNIRANAASAKLGGVYASSTLHMYIYDYYWME